MRAGVRECRNGKNRDHSDTETVSHHLLEHFWKIPSFIMKPNFQIAGARAGDDIGGLPRTKVRTILKPPKPKGS
jgi:hypothetical protein